ncbi:hypothetical protein BDZ45DRAFT_694796 [Acephala macrosclerotiorum]|nr:hypothetical protein BDZ45DRAFT_694796 [Acephala macrosclerotiorum]
MPSQKRSASAPASLPTEKRRRLSSNDSLPEPAAEQLKVPGPSGQCGELVELEEKKNVEPKDDVEVKEEVKKEFKPRESETIKENVLKKSGLSRKRPADPLDACFMPKKKKRVAKKLVPPTSIPPKCMALVKWVAPISLPAAERPTDDLFGDDAYDSGAFRKEFGYEKKEKKKDPAPKGESDEQGYFAFTGRRTKARHAKYKSAYNHQFTNVFATQPPPMSEEDEYIEFEKESTEFFASDADSKSVSFPTIRSKPCGQKGCTHFTKLRICQHDIE